jgi:hypothetical protein
MLMANRPLTIENFTQICKSYYSLDKCHIFHPRTQLLLLQHGRHVCFVLKESVIDFRSHCFFQQSDQFVTDFFVTTEFCTAVRV